MRVLLAGAWLFAAYEEALAAGFRAEGHEVVAFSWGHLHFSWRKVVRRNASLTFGTRLGVLVRYIQAWLLVGPLISRLNEALVARAVETSCDMVFIFRGTPVRPATLARLRERLPRVVIVDYNNDDPFAPCSYLLFRHFRACISGCDLVYAYRPNNLDAYRRHGARTVGLLMPWYVPELDKPEQLSPADRDRFACDAVFIGHYEDDGRAKILEALMRADFRIRLFGAGWDRAARHSALLGTLGPVRPLIGRDYRRALSAATTALCFLSRRNRDVYTRRNFEIPAVGTAMVSQYTPELAALFEEGKEAFFFRSFEQLLEILHACRDDPSLARRVGEAGRLRVQHDRHDVYSRARVVIADVQRLRANAPRVPEAT